MMIRAVFFDIDGTLIPIGGTQMPSETIDTLKKLKQKGCKIFIATGRNVRELDIITNDFAFDGYITLNGQLCFDEHFHMLYGNPIHPEDMEVLKMVYETKKVPVAMIGQNRSYINYIDSRVHRIHQDINIALPEIDDYDEETVYQLNIYADQNYAEKLFPYLPHSRMSRWHPYGIDVFSDTGGKAAGIQRILQHFGISQKETMAFGDGDNDIEMLRYVALGVAMGGADLQVKSAADHVTDNVEKQGIRKAVEYFETAL